MGRFFGPAQHLIQPFIWVPLLKTHLSSGSQSPYQNQVLVEMGKGKLWEGVTVNWTREGSGSMVATQKFQSGHHLDRQVAEIGPD